MESTNLTPREKEVLLLAAEGYTDKEIAERLEVGHGTVTTHWTRMRERTGATNRAQVLALELSRIYRETEAERSRSALLYRALIDNLEDFAVFHMDMDRKVLSWNPGVGKILGYSEEEWIGCSGDVLFTHEDRERRAPEKEQETARLEGRATDDRWHERKDGSHFWASGVMVGVRDPEGNLLCFSKILRDLTSLKRLEDHLHELLKSGQG